MLENLATASATASADLLATISAGLADLTAGSSGIPVASGEASMSGVLDQLFREHPFLALCFSLAIVIWILVWKAVGMWRAAKLNHRFFFGLMLLDNGLSLGLFEIVYYYYLAQLDWVKVKKNGLAFLGITTKEAATTTKLKQGDDHKLP